MSQLKGFDSDTALAHLTTADPVMARIIAAVGPFTLEAEPAGFTTLVDAIVSQQISVKAANAIMQRLVNHVGDITPAALLAHDAESLRGAGLSGQKARYILDLAAHVADGRLDLAHLPTLDDETIITQLTQVKGIGRWTAEMYLIFALLRPNVLPVADLGIRQGVQRAYDLPSLPSAAEVHAAAAAWTPFASVGSWYIWRSLKLPAEFFASETSV